MITITANVTTTSAFREDDLQQHVEDTRLYWVSSHGRQYQVSWNELTDLEREQVQEAEARAAYVAMFSIYD